MEKNITPYTTKTGLKIGEFYEEKRHHEMNFDMELIQSAYLNDSRMFRSQFISKIKYVAFLVGTMLLLALVTKD